MIQSQVKQDLGLFHRALFFVIYGQMAVYYGMFPINYQNLAVITNL